MAFFRSLILVVGGLAAGGVLLLAHRSAQETGKGFAESLTDVPGEAQLLFGDLRGRAEEAVVRGREAYYQKQAEIEERLEDLSQA
jgi:hypothetical protein